MVGMQKTCAQDDLYCLDFWMTAYGPWREGTLSGQQGCPSFEAGLEGNYGWGKCEGNLLFKGFYREVLSEGHLGALADCKCVSPTPSLTHADCYVQATHFSFEEPGRWGYCQRPGYFMNAM